MIHHRLTNEDPIVNAISQYQNYLSIKTTEIAEVFNYYFSNEVPDLGLKTPDTLILHSLKNENPIVNAASEYQIYHTVKT